MKQSTTKALEIPMQNNLSINKGFSFPNGLGIPFEINLTTGTGLSLVVHALLVGVLYLILFHQSKLLINNINMSLSSFPTTAIARPKPLDEWIVADKHHHYRMVKKAPDPPKPEWVPAAQTARQPAWVGNLLDPDDYPLAARQQGSDGKVVVQVHIDAAGVVQEVKLLSGNSDVLNQFVVSKVHNGIFTPAYNQDGLPVACEVILPIVFQLNG